MCKYTDCKYCLENYNGYLDKLIDSPCMCKNSVHISCIVKWFWVSSKTHCPECKYDLLRENIKYYYFFTKGCLGFLNFCVTVTDILFKK